MLKYTRHKVDLQESDQRLDRFLARLYPRVAKSLWQKALRRRDVRVNGKSARPDYRMCTGDEVSIFSGLLNVCDEIKSEAKPIDPTLVSLLKNTILHQGDDFTVLNKPRGCACQGGVGVRVRLDQALPVALERPAYLVHRLDKETSGALLVAHTSKAAAFFAQCFQERRVLKTYIALLRGHLPAHTQGGVYTSWLRKEPKGRHESMVCFDLPVPGAQEARTRFEVLEMGMAVSCVRMIPETGRKHQLRAQTAHLGAPIWGDDRYSVKSDSGLCLHALTLCFELPSGETIEVVAPVPEAFQKTACALGLSYDFTAAKMPEQKE